MVDTLGETALEDLCLQTSLQEILNLESEHIIETHPALIEHTDTDQPSDEGITFEKTLGVFVVQFQKLTSSTSDF